MRSFAVFEGLCSDLGFNFAPEKSAFPSTRMEWLGFTINSVAMDVTIPEAKIKEILHLTDSWRTKE